MKHLKYVAAALCVLSMGVFGGCGSEVVDESGPEADPIDVGEAEEAICMDPGGAPSPVPPEDCSAGCKQSVRNWLASRIVAVCWHLTTWNASCHVISDAGPCNPTACANLLASANLTMDSFCNSGLFTVPQFQECAGSADEYAVCQAKCMQYTQYQCNGTVGAKQPDYNNCLNAC